MTKKERKKKNYVIQPEFANEKSQKNNNPPDVVYKYLYLFSSLTINYSKNQVQDKTLPPLVFAMTVRRKCKK